MKKIGLLGVGHLGKIHLRLLLEIPEWEVVGIYDANAEIAAKVGETMGVKVFESVEELIANVDAVDIVTPTTTHYALAKQVMEAGKHVFIEKPLTHTLTQAEALMQLAAQQQLIVQVGHVERFNPAFLAIENRPMTPMFVEVHRLAQWNPRGTDVSVVLDIMIHDLDIVLSVVKSEVKNIYASGTPVIAATPDIANVRLEFENGCVANLTASRISMKNMRKLRFFQPNSYTSIDCLDKKVEIIRIPEEGEQEEIGSKMRFDFDTGAELKPMMMETPEVKPINAIKMELMEFYEAIAEGKPVRVSIEDGYRALKVAQGILDRMNVID